MLLYTVLNLYAGFSETTTDCAKCQPSHLLLAIISRNRVVGSTGSATAPPDARELSLRSMFYRARPISLQERSTKRENASKRQSNGEKLTKRFVRFTKRNDDQGM
jgi:hypothetical protein